MLLADGVVSPIVLADGDRLRTEFVLWRPARRRGEEHADESVGLEGEAIERATEA